MMMSWMKIAAANVTAVLVLGLGATSVHAAVLNAAADTFVSNQSADTNYGSATTLQVANDGGSPIPKGKDRLGVVRFDLSSVSGPVTGVTLALTSTTDFVFTIYGVNDGGTDENFDESTLTFNSFAYSSASAGDGSIVTSGLTELATGISDDADGNSDNVLTISTAALLSFINADTNDIVTFVIFHTSPQNGNFASFNSHEATSGGPALTVLIPEPATLALLGFSGLMLAGARKRRA